jgi:hypothetical protein
VLGADSTAAQHRTSPRAMATKWARVKPRVQRFALPCAATAAMARSISAASPR